MHLLNYSQNIITMASTGKTYIVEHLDDELGPWSKLEYMTIAKESHENGAKVKSHVLKAPYYKARALTYK